MTRTARVGRVLLRELRDWQRERRRLGTRLATIKRGRALLGVDDLDARLAAMEVHASRTRDLVTSLQSTTAGHAADQDDVRRQLAVWTVTTWVEHTEVPDDLVVSIVLPTRDRVGRLQRAVESVLAQSYEQWELLIVDDGSTDETPAYLAELNDKRIRTFRIEHAGVCAARNHALEHADGDIVAYLDDDNLMYRSWLGTVVWAFRGWPDADVVFGARIVDDYARVHQLGTGGLPFIHFHDYDREQLERGNMADMGVIAHRARLPEARFDEALSELGDWDLFLRLTTRKPPLQLPTLACLYTTSAPERLSDAGTTDREMRYVRAKLQSR